jgi:4-aminobutyrate--pyruvate transaminase
MLGTPENREGKSMSRATHNVAPPGTLAARDLESLLHPATNLATHHERGPLVFARAEGIYIWDESGKQYLEGLAGLWCTALGYGVDELVETAARQMKKLTYSHLFGGRSHEPAIALAEKLKSMMPFDVGRVFFGNSGSDANDTQVKLAWYYNNAIGRREKKKIISRAKAYHGVTVASGSLTGLPAFHRDFDLPIPQVLHTDCPHYYRFGEPGESEAEFASRLADNLEQLILKEGPDTVAAFIAEPVMGAGGVIPPPATYFEKIKRVLDKYDVWLIDDEVICGFGRTGNPFGCETYGFIPTTMTVAKALSSAYLPISAVLIPEWMYEPFVEQSRQIGTFGHGFTYSGHPVCAAVALKNLELIEERDIFAHAAARAPRFQERLAALGDHPLVGETRGVGLVGGLELVANKETRAPFDPTLGVGLTCVDRCEDEGLIVRPLGDTIAICPPLIINDAQIDELFDKLTRALDQTLARVGSDS